MHTFKAIGALLLLATTSLALSPPVCPTCNPISGQNNCHPTTSCISTGKHFHCACRAGYKAFEGDDSRQFRLPFKNYEFLVFTHENTECNVLCDEYTQPPPALCSEVPLRKQCPVSELQSFGKRKAIRNSAALMVSCIFDDVAHVHTYRFNSPTMKDTLAIISAVVWTA
uniref:EGF-like calcium-binding domain-containing protein n=1 Tax=Coccidioides posadasii RMSCC 3488 TaxID=454284 RepID=A0A0J6FJU7_COCPO|nr:hypothetical protein CPAG_05974 [Coccidioides posadasii RMSCC 3488]